jgi:ribosome-associated protein
LSERNENYSQQRALLLISTLLEKKAKDIVVLSVREISTFTDYFIICSGTSDRQVRAISSHIQESLKKAGLIPLGVEGEKEGKWILLDYDDVIVHVFLEAIRTFYDLERLWSEAPRIAVPDDTTSLKTKLNI